MFIVKNVSKSPSGKIYGSTLLRESYREGGKVKKRTIANLSRCSEEEIDAISHALKNKNSKVIHGEFEILQGRSIGSVYLLFTIAKRLGIVDALGSSFQAKLALWLIIARILEQGSRLSATRLHNIYDIASILQLERGFDENNLYDCLKWLDKNQKQIENSLFQRKNKSQKFFWYDVTSSYFEGIHNELAAFGYDRDKKKRKRIVVVGLLCQEEGDPVSIEAFKGNTQDTQTFENQLKKLKERFECESITMICDRGIIRDKQKQLLGEYGFHYITALPMRQITPLLNAKVFIAEQFTHKLQSKIHDGRRYIYRRNPERALETQKQREERLGTVQKRVNQENARLQEKPKTCVYAALRRTKKYLQRLCLHEWVSVVSNKKKLILIEDKENLKKKSEFDGCYIWTTDLSKEELSNREVYKQYKNLKYVEDDFKNHKTGFLEIRPIFVRSEESTRGHLLVTMLAYIIVRELKKAWETHNKTVPEALTELSLLCRQTIKFSDKKIACIPTPTQEMSRLLDAAKVQMPNSIAELTVPVVTRSKVRKKAIG